MDNWNYHGIVFGIVMFIVGALVLGTIFGACATALLGHML